ncbi:unnamed protein product [Natator depressus]
MEMPSMKRSSERFGGQTFPRRKGSGYSWEPQLLLYQNPHLPEVQNEAHKLRSRKLEVKWTKFLHSMQLFYNLFYKTMSGVEKRGKLQVTMQSSSAEVTMMESQNRKRAPAWTEREVRDLIAV